MATKQNAPVLPQLAAALQAKFIPADTDPTRLILWYQHTVRQRPSFQTVEADIGKAFVSIKRRPMQTARALWELREKFPEEFFSSRIVWIVISRLLLEHDKAGSWFREQWRQFPDKNRWPDVAEGKPMRGRHKRPSWSLSRERLLFHFVDWQSAEIADLYWAHNWQASRIGHKLGMTENAVEQTIKRLQDDLA